MLEGDPGHVCFIPPDGWTHRPFSGMIRTMMASHRYAEAEAHLSAADPVIARLIAERGTCRLEPDPRHFLVLVRAIVGQQISVKAAASIRGRLAGLMPGGEVTPEGIVALDEEQLRAAGLSRPKARYIRDLAEKVVAGVVELARLPEMEDEEVIRELVQVKGIGRWTAEMFLIFCLGRLDVLSVDDMGVRAAVRRAYGLSALPGKPELHAIAEPWHPYASIATWYLWRSLDNVPQAPTG